MAAIKWVVTQQDVVEFAKKKKMTLSDLLIKKLCVEFNIKWRKRLHE